MDTATVDVRRRIESVMGPLPDAPGGEPPPYEVVRTTEHDDHVDEEIRYRVDDGPWTPAHLLRPRGAEGTGRPGALALHPTQIELGSRVVVDPDPERHRDYAVRLVRAGHVVLAPSYPTMGGYRPDLAALGYRSGTMKAIRDNVRGIDLLLSLPGVDAGGVLAMGHSLGGHNSLFTAAHDPRVRAVVTSCGFDSFSDYQGGDLSGWLQQRYMPRLAPDPAFDFDDVLALQADRAVFVSAPLHDGNFVADSVDRLVAAVADEYDRRGGALEVHHPDCGHDFPPDLQDAAIRFAGAALRAGNR